MKVIVSYCGLKDESEINYDHRNWRICKMRASSEEIGYGNT
jgi:hypothetical protein